MTGKEPHADATPSRAHGQNRADDGSAAPRGARTKLLDTFERFHWLHARLGLAGNVAFFVGSVLFLWGSTQVVGTWLFIVGSFGMLLGSIGDKAAHLRGDA
ncbi:MAG: YrhK family protein [Egibacteraceae bacterium]